MDCNLFEKELISAMNTVKIGIQKIIEPIAKKENLTIIQLLVLFRIKENEVTTIGDLYKEFAINQGNASSLCKKMEQDGLINRKRDSNDERVVILNLTVEGSKKIEDIYKHFENLSNYLKDMPNEKYQVIIDGMQEFNNLLKLVSKDN